MRKIMSEDKKKILDELRSLPKETEWLEFKEAKKQFDFGKLGKYFSALSNEAYLQNKDFGYLVLGVEDINHDIVGTNWRRGSHDGLKEEISKHTTGGISFVAIDEILNSEGRVLLFKIPVAPKGMPIAWKGHYYGRVDETLSALTIDEIDRIRGPLHDWSADFCPSATLGDLDLQAINFARVEFTRKYSALEKEIKAWDDKTFLNKAKLSIKGKLTKTAILLLGKSESTHFLSPVIGRMTWIVKNDQNQDLDYEHFNPPFLLASQKLREKIRNLKYRYMPDQTLFPEELLKYDPWVIREALHNCIAHQDYSLIGKITVVENPDELVFSNMGSFLPGSIEKVIEEDAPPKQYRNPFLVNAMADLNMIDTIGSGIKRMYLTQRERYFPMPTYDLRKQEVTVHILGKILNPSYTKLLRLHGDIDLNSIILLDYVQKRSRISKEAHKLLKVKKLVEGRYPNIHLSSEVHEILDRKGEYITKRGLDNDYYEKLILEYLKKFSKAGRKEINQLLLDKLSDVLNEQQKIKKISNILFILSNKKGLIVNNSKSTRYPVWSLKGS